MPLKTIIMNILTFGIYGLKKLSELKAEELKTARSLTERASALTELAEKSPPRMVSIQAFKTTDYEYLRKIAEISDIPEFRFFCFNVQRDIFELMNSATDEKAVEIMGMSKGFKYFLKILESSRAEYKELTVKKPEIETEDSVYV